MSNQVALLRYRRYCAMLVAVVVPVFAASPSSPGKDEPPPVQPIQADDLTSKRVQIVGRLGHSLGEMLTIRGKWKGPAGRIKPKDARVRLWVTHVDGQPLESTVDFPDVFLPEKMTAAALDGKVCELRGFEGGRFRGAPTLFHREQNGLKGDGGSPVADQYGFTFITDFQTASLRITDKPSKPMQAKAANNDVQCVEQIQAADITSKRVQIIGRLGHPLGTMLSIRGRWEHPDPRVKDYALRFVATDVEGEKLASSVEFDRGAVYLPPEESPDSLARELCEVRGFEGGRFRGAPNEFYGKAVQQPHGFGFATEFHAASVKLIDGKRQPAKATAKSRRIPRQDAP